MKKTFPYILVICIAIGFIYLDERNRNVERDTTPSTTPPAVQWANWEDTKKRFGYDVLGVAESIEWLAKHRDAISLPEKIDFLDTYYLTEMPFSLYGIAITTDQYGRYRVFSRSWLPPWPPEGFMNETDSIAWLKAQGYRVEKTDAGYNLKRDQGYHTGNVKFSFTEDKLIGWGSTQTFSDGTVIVTKQGRGIAIKAGGSLHWMCILS